MDLSQSHRQWVRVCVPGAGRCLHNFTLTHRGDVFGRFLLLASFVVRFPSGSAHTGNNISRNSSACKVKAKPTSISSSPSFGVRAFFLRDSDLDWSVFGKRRRRKRPRVPAGQMTINAKINLPSPARARAGSVCRRSARTTKVSPGREVRKRRTISLLSASELECIISRSVFVGLDHRQVLLGFRKL